MIVNTPKLILPQYFFFCEKQLKLKQTHNYQTDAILRKYINISIIQLKALKPFVSVSLPAEEGNTVII